MCPCRVRGDWILQWCQDWCCCCCCWCSFAYFCFLNLTCSSGFPCKVSVVAPHCCELPSHKCSTQNLDSCHKGVLDPQTKSLESPCSVPLDEYKVSESGHCFAGAFLPLLPESPWLTFAARLFLSGLLLTRIPSGLVFTLFDITSIGSSSVCVLDLTDRSALLSRFYTTSYSFVFSAASLS